MSQPANDPRMFALTRDEDGSEQVVGYGIVLPDGSALSTSWPASLGSSVFSSANAESCAALRGAELVWIGE